MTGSSGTGKSTLLIKLIKKEKARFRFVYDHQGEWSQKLKIPCVYDIERLAERTAMGGYVIYDPVKMFSGRPSEGLAFFCDYVFAICGEMRGRKLLIVDELQKLTDNKKEPAELLNILDSGRRIELDFYCISQAPNRLHNAVRNQITQVYTFRQNEARALEYLEDNGFPPEMVRSLGEHKYLWKNLRTGETNFSDSNAKTETQPERKADSTAAIEGQ